VLKQYAQDDVAGRSRGQQKNFTVDNLPRNWQPLNTPATALEELWGTYYAYLFVTAALRRTSAIQHAMIAHHAATPNTPPAHTSFALGCSVPVLREGPSESVWLAWSQ